MKSLSALKSEWSNAERQVAFLEQAGHREPFYKQLAPLGLYPLRPTETSIFQVNLGKMCNQVCRHCHVDAGPDRKEIMTQETMQKCLEVLASNPEFKTVDLTGGAPEMNPHFGWFVEQIKALDRHVLVRCNLTIIVANPKYNDLPQFYAKHAVEVASSLPFYTSDRTDKQRGDGVFTASIQALSMLNEAGYGQINSGLVLNLVYNPAGAFLPASQAALEAEYKRELLDRHGIYFNNLFVITNMPISRYLTYLIDSGNYEAYMDKLVASFNPVAATNVMCRNTLSIGWDGYIYDCDFNQMLELKVNCGSTHINNYSRQDLQNREISIGQHCYGCTAGSGSSCGGATS